MNLRIGIIILVTLLNSEFAGAQLLNCGQVVAPEKIAFQDGEMLKYTVSYSAAVINTDVADVTFTTHSGSYSNLPTYEIKAIGKTRPFYNFFFAMEDIYNTTLNATTLRPIRSSSNLNEGGYKYRTNFDYDFRTMNVSTMGHNVKRGTTYRHKMKLSECSYDAVALFYNLRCSDLSQLQLGQRQKVDLVLEDTIRVIEFRFLGRENRKIDGVGTFRTLKFSSNLVTENGESFKDGTEFFIWLSDDRNHIPIYMESPIRVGSIKVKLASWANLRHSFSSVVVSTK